MALRKDGPLLIAVNDRRNLYGDVLDRSGLRLDGCYRRHVNRRTGRRAASTSRRARRAPRVMAAVNLGLRFVLELCMLAAVALWGARTGSGTSVHVVTGIAAPLAAAAVWRLAISTKARFRLARPWWVLLQLALFGLTAAALAAAGHSVLGLAFAVASVSNLALLVVLGSADAR
jgi:hypothetical protein